MSEKILEAGNRKKYNVRKDIRTLSKEELDLLIKAWIGIQTNPPEQDNPNPNSFFTIAGFHGEPFRGAGYGNPSWWGGYCNHGNVLFPTWHRAYLLCLEKALRRVPGCENVTLPYWNQIAAADDTSNPIPDIFLRKEYVFKNGIKVPNPLYSYRFQKAIHDRLSPIPDADYSKDYDYETVRYPFSGLVGTSDVAATDAHNQLMNSLGEQTTTGFLQSNVSNWLIGTVINDQGKKIGGGTTDNYIRSLFAPNYTVYSNTTSAQRWNDDNFDSSKAGDTAKADLAVVPIEKPHNAIHLAVGGFDVPGIANYSFVPDANGDMGENDTAAFDPIFYFHHCFIDLMFWAWQLKHKKGKKLDIIPKYPGTNSVDYQGPTPGISGGTWLGLDTPLDPFVNDTTGEPMTSNDVTNIFDLGYHYDGLAKELSEFEDPDKSATPHIRISGISRADAKGSFFLSAWASEPNSDTQTLVGVEPVLSRWHVAGCANCGTHLNVSTVISLPGWKLPDATHTSFDVLVHTRDRRFGRPSLGGKTPSVHLGKMLGIRE